MRAITRSQYQIWVDFRTCKSLFTWLTRTPSHGVREPFEWRNQILHLARSNPSREGIEPFTWWDRNLNMAGSNPLVRVKQKPLDWISFNGQAFVLAIVYSYLGQSVRFKINIVTRYLNQSQVFSRAWSSVSMLS